MRVAATAKAGRVGKGIRLGIERASGEGRKEVRPHPGPLPRGEGEGRKEVRPWTRSGVGAWSGPRPRRKRNCWTAKRRSWLDVHWVRCRIQWLAG